MPAKIAADSISAFLVDSLGVPPANVINLRNASSKCADILGALKSIRDDPRIIKDDNAILIYFAGHGGRQETPPGWYSVDGQIEIICPSDISDSRAIVGIPDRTIAFLINEIAKAKGDNITLILDCCSSAGGNRKGQQKHLTARNIPNPPTMPADCDANIVGPSGGFRTVGVSASKARAYEMQEYEHGVFTHALMTAFKANDFHELTYTSLMDRLEMPPFVADAQRVPTAKPHTATVASLTSDYLTGTAHGITSGMSIAIYESTASNSIFRASSRTTQSVHTAIVDTEVEADLTVILDVSGSVAFARSAHPKSALEEPIARHTGQRICGALPASDALGIVAVIESASHFYHHLRRVAPPMEMESNCEIHMHGVARARRHARGRRAFSRWPQPPRARESHHVLRAGPNVPHGHDPAQRIEPRLVSLRLLLRSVRLHYPALVRPSTGPAHRTHGYGNSGAQPWSFEVRDGEEVEVGFIKVFLTQRPVDLRRIAQESVFVRKGGEGMRLGAGRESVPELMMSEWRTKVETIVLTRR
ncbi:hypothetical protein DFH09DRAFT_1488908 [Mycena vulgaris]|nr:hypothetical protein DFH09DRAFT_1488908 [Mycena vulgaris]